MQQAVEVAQVRNDEMAEATKTAECQNGLPGESGGNLGPRRPNKCMECNCLASLWSTAGVGLGRACSVSAVGCESTRRDKPPRLCQVLVTDPLRTTVAVCIERY